MVDQFGEARLRTAHREDRMFSSLRAPTSRRALLIGAAAAVATGVAAARAQRVVYEPTPHETVERMLRLARVGVGDFVIDLGSGDGRIPIAAARDGARALGVEIDPALIAKARANAQAAGVAARVSFRQQDLFETPLGEATVIALYLLPEMNERLRPRLMAVRPGTRIIAHRFGIGDWQPDAVDDDGGRVMLWIVPAQVAGRWQLRHGEDRIVLELRQRYQEISGSAVTVAGTPLKFSAGRLHGDAIEFALDLRGRPTRFRGTVAGNAMQGAGGGSGFATFSGAWQASRQ
jgi:SAM-dependent methyltransferase